MLATQTNAVRCALATRPHQHFSHFRMSHSAIAYRYGCGFSERANSKRHFPKTNHWKNISQIVFFTWVIWEKQNKKLTKSIKKKSRKNEKNLWKNKKSIKKGAKSHEKPKLEKNLGVLGNYTQLSKFKNNIVCIPTPRAACGNVRSLASFRRLHFCWLSSKLLW